MLKIFQSNKIELLYKELKENLFLNSSVFSKRVILVPTQAIKSWLMLQLAQDPNLEIAAGVEILYFQEGLNRLVNLTGSINEKHTPSKLELALAIETFIKKICLGSISLSSENKKMWEPLFRYLKLDVKSSINRKSEKRLVSLSESLADQFINYAKFGTRMIKEWEAQPSQNWQAQIWFYLFSTWDQNWGFPSEKDLDLQNSINSKTQFYIFSVNFIPQNELHILDQLSNLIPIHMYFLSPCQLFWSDILSDRETKKLKDFWERQAVSKNEIALLETYLENKNPLLANWGKLGRKFLEKIEEFTVQSSEVYEIAGAAEQIDQYDFTQNESLVFNTRNNPFNLLEALQTDILTLRNPELSETIVVNNSKSFQLHYAPTKQREVQILYHNLVKQFTLIEDLKPSDIIVMAPNIQDYAPYIHQFFGAQDSLFDFQMMDLQATEYDLCIQQFLHLIQLPLGRWDIADFIYIFSSKFFQKRQEISQEEFYIIKDWLLQTKILWGSNSAHRNEFLFQQYDKISSSSEDRGTWENGFSKLIKGLISANNSISLEFSNSQLLGKLIFILRSLKADLTQLSNNSQLTYLEWGNVLKNIIQKYLLDESEKEEFEKLERFIDEITLASRWISEQKTSFNCYRSHFEANLNYKTSNYKENQLHGICFCSMVPMRAVPAKVIALLGMEESAFPRSEFMSSLDLMQNNALCDFKPSRADYDRYFLLETLISARNSLIVSFSQYSEDAQEQSLSLIIQELLDYIYKAFDVSDPYVFKHPFKSFDKAYFKEGSLLDNFSILDFDLATLQLKEKEPPHHFIPNFKPLHENVLPDEKELVVPIRKLKTSIQNPIQSYFTQTLGIWLKEDETIQTEENFTLDSLQMYHLKQLGLKKTVDEVVAAAGNQEILPHGVFKNAAEKRLRDLIEKQEKILEKLQVDKKQIFDIELQDHFLSPQLDNTTYKFPPLIIELDSKLRIKIIGNIENISSEGLLTFSGSDPQDAIKTWVDFTLMNLIIENYNLPIKKQLICLGNAKQRLTSEESNLDELKKMLIYYFYSLKNVSPLQKEYIAELLKQDNETDFNSLLTHKIKNPFKPIYNKPLEWLCRSNELDGNGIHTHWKEKGENLFGKLLQNWTVKK